MNKLILFIQIVILLVAVSPVSAQTGDPVVDSVVSKIDKYGQKKSSSILFSHFDKSVYTDNEDVWFTTYLLNFNKKSNTPSIATVLLVNTSDKSLLLEKHFVMNSGMSFGHLVIPEKIQPGDYSFIVYTNILSDGMPVDLFVQHVVIKSISRYDFSTVLRTDRDREGNLSVLVKANFRDGKPVAAASIHYNLGMLSGNAKTDEKGMFLLKVPIGKTLDDKSVFRASVKFNDELNTASIRLPSKSVGFNVQFFPEGGHLVNELTGVVGVEIKNASGAPVAAKVVLYRNQIPVGTIFTDNYGLGKFSIAPSGGSKYELKVVGNAADTAYLIPRPLGQGAIISLSKALCDDSLSMKLLSTDINKFFVVIHNYSQSFYSFPVMASPIGRGILINLKDLPRGLHTITLLDTEGRPVAERLFFAHYTQGIPLTLLTDHKTYSNREKVTLSIRLGDKTKEMINGLVSISCVEAGRVDTSKISILNPMLT